MCSRKNYFRMAYVSLLLILIGVKINYENNLSNKLNFKPNGVYFIGSSRISRSVDVNDLHKKNSASNFYNLGIPQATFYHNILLSEQIIKVNKPKIIFIELSSIIYENREELKLLGVMPNSNLKHIDASNLFEVSQCYLYDILSFKLVFNQIISPNKLIQNIGFVPKQGNFCYSTQSFLKPNDLKKISNINIDNYLKYIKYLTKIAATNNVKIKFVLPLTFNRNVEKNTVCKVYEQLEENLKLPYSTEFLQQMNNSKLLNDKNHLNTDGAKIFTEYIHNFLNSNHNN